MSLHECKQEQRLESCEAAHVRHTKELYEGREGRQPVTVRLDRCERVVNALVYVSSALLVSVLIGAGTVVWRTVIDNARARTAAVAVHGYEPALSKN